VDVPENPADGDYYLIITPGHLDTSKYRGAASKKYL